MKINIFSDRIVIIPELDLERKYLASLPKEYEDIFVDKYKELSLEYTPLTIDWGHEHGDYLEIFVRKEEPKK